MQEEKVKRSIDQLNRIVFPLVYGEGSKDNALATQLFELFIEYASNKGECILKKDRDRKEIVESLTKSSPQSEASSKSLIIKFMCEYGCVIKLTKDKEHSPINIQIIMLEKWATGAHDCQAKKLQLVNPDGQSSLFTPSLSIHSQNLQKFASSFDVDLIASIQKIRQREQQLREGAPFELTPKVLEEACKMAMYQKPSYYHSREKKKEEDGNKQKNERADTIGFYFSVSHSQADISWYVAKAAVLNLLGIQKEQLYRANKFVIGFRGWLLKQATSEKAKKRTYLREEVQSYKLCLDQIITQYKQKVSKYSKKIQKFIQLTTTIEKNILDIKGGKFTSKISEKQNYYKKLEIEVRQRPTMVIHQQIPHKRQKIQEKVIDQFPISVEQRYPFEDLYDMYQTIDQKNQSDISKWLLLTQQTIWNLTKQLCNGQKTIDLHLHMRQIECEQGASTMGEIVLIYEREVNKNLAYYGMQLTGQAVSHIQLVRAITAVLAFECVKLNRARKKSHLFQYKVPFDIDELFKKFHSNSREARKAMKHLKIYNENRKEKKKIFELNDSSTSFYAFGKEVAKETRSAKVWVQSMGKMTQLEKQLQACKLSIQQHEQRANILAGHSSRFEITAQWITNTLGKISSFNIQSPRQYCPAGDPWLYAFLNNIPPDVNGMIKLLFLAQNPIQGKQLSEETNLIPINNLFLGEKLPIKVFSKKLLGTQSLSSQNASKQYIQTIPPQNRVCLLSNNSLNCSNYNTAEFYKQINQFQCDKEDSILRQTLKNFLKPPVENDMTREHELYASLSKKPIELDLQNFEAMSNVRSAEHTQLILLCTGILERKIISNSYDIGPMFAERLILQTGGRISAYHKSTEKHFGKIQKLVTEFINVWGFTDTRFCPILAPLISFFASELVDDNLVNKQNVQEVKNMHFQLSLKCWEQFKRAEKELLEKPGEKIQWDQRYVSMAAICCFREVQFDQTNDQQIIFLLKLIFQLRVTKILSDRQDRPDKKRPFQIELEFQVEKAIYHNIEIISEYVASNQKQLSEIVTQFDNSFPQDVAWTRINLFHFRGVSQESKDVYQLNIYSGSIYKNGKEISCLDEKIKANPYYIEIFGEDRQFQVFPSNYQHYLRTKDNLNHQFRIEEKSGKIYLQFSQDGTQIRHIIKKQGAKLDQQIWTLIPRQKLKESQCHIPQIFMQNHLAWYSDRRKCIAFRKPTFGHLYQIGMVVFLDLSKPQSTIIAASHITYHGSFNNQILDDICNPKNQRYEELILRHNNKKLNLITPFRVLSQFQPTQFIIELKSRKTNQIHYWLHRYQLRFKVVNESRLLSQSYFGYALDYSYHDTANSLFNQFPCLVLEKYLKSPTIANNHNKILLISDGKIKQNGKIDKDQGEKLKAKLLINLYKYDIHDFFGDIRGLNRESILHLAALMLSINDNIKIGSIEMTPLQYAMYLMKSCFTNRPFSEIQSKKLGNIFDLATTEVVLLGEALWKMAGSLSEILPFPAGKFISFGWLKQKFLMCRTLYENSYNNDTIRFREKINKDILNFLGVNLHQNAGKKIDSSDSSSDEFEHSELFWKGYKVYTGENLVQKISEIADSYKEFQKQTKALNIWNQAAVKQGNMKFPEQIGALTAIHKNDEMMDEMIKELSNSYNVYCREEARIAQIASKITPQEKNNQLNLIKVLKEEANKILSKIQQIIDQMKKQNESHPDVITGIRPTLSPAMYTSILCQINLILEYYPVLHKPAAKLLKKAMKIWLELKTRTCSFQRIEQLLLQEKVDVVAVMREVLSPREVVFDKNEWLCFEAEMKVQLWPSQLETYNNLMSEEKSGSFCQLNMGEGKTQVIIPLIILNTIYANKGSKKCLPRINLLSSLFEEARGNFFRFISATGFQIPAFEIPFNRKVKLVSNQINSVKHLIDSFSNKAYILMTRQSRLSEILRFHEGKIIRKNINQKAENMQIYRAKDKNFEFDLGVKDCNKPLIQNQIFDVFDEIDALMYCKKSYIFSIGDHLDLAQDMMRFEIIKLCIQVFLVKYFEGCLKQKIAVTDQTDEDALDMVEKGEYPIGLRLTLENSSEKRILQLRRAIAETIVFESQRHEYSFVKLFKSKQQKEELINYLINPEATNGKAIPPIVPDASKPQIYLLRGILAYGIFEHCLAMRCGVDFGAPNALHVKRIAVPYEAADIPSKTSEYEQPDVSTLLSYISYFTKGLSEQYFQDCLKALLELSKTSKEMEFQQWISVLKSETRRKLELKTVDKINFNSKAHRQYMFKTFRKNRRTIAFWLIKCVFLKDLKQYAKSICSSAWDLADVNKSVGFSGTKDNRWLYSNLLNWKPCKTPEIMGTDGKMLHLITKFTNEVALIEENNKTLWQRFIDLALAKGVGCIIDAGAICVGKSLKDEIVPWMAEHEMFNSDKYVGISFCDNSGQWLVYDIQGKFYIPRGTTIPDHQTFVIFDQARTRGADLKMDGDVVAALSLGPELTKDSLMQAAGRLRKFGRNQSLIIMATQEVFSHLPLFPKSAKEYKSYIEELNTKNRQKLPKLIISWCCENSIKDNHDLLMQFAELGWKYIYSKVNKSALEQELTTDLEIMYSKPLVYSTVSQLGRKSAENKKDLAGHPSGKFICQILQKYGKTVRKQAGTLDDVCQREVEAEKQKQKEQEDELSAVKAIPEVIKPEILTEIKEHPFVFDPRFKMTSNLIRTTQSLVGNNKNQIPEVYFIKISSTEIVAISIREASIFIENNIIKQLKNEPYQLFMLNSLQLESEIIKNNKHQGAFVSAKFLSGVENYNNEEEDHLLKMLINSTKMKKEWSEDYCLLVSLFLKLKRIYLKKFKGSTLEKMVTRLYNRA